MMKIGVRAHDLGRRSEEALPKAVRAAGFETVQLALTKAIDGIEPVADHTLNTPELARRLLDEVGSDKVKIIFDPVNTILAETADRQKQIYESFFSHLGQDIRIVHVKDSAFEHGEKVWRAIGRGMVNNRFVFDWLRANKPDAPILREHAHNDSSAADVAAMRALAGRD